MVQELEQSRAVFLGSIAKNAIVTFPVNLPHLRKLSFGDIFPNCEGNLSQGFFPTLRKLSIVNIDDNATVNNLPNRNA